MALLVVYNKIMVLLLGLFRWWYSEGLDGQLKSSRERLAEVADFFSIVLLLKTLFSPFRQIDAGGVKHGPIGVKIRAWVDKLISRLIGAVIRSLTIIAGIIALGVSVLFIAFRLGGWALLPVLPVIGIILALTGWVPWNL